MLQSISQCTKSEEQNSIHQLELHENVKKKNIGNKKMN